MLWGLPVADPQFWLVTALAVGAAGWALRRLARAADRAAPPCASCPKSAAARHARRT